MLQFHWVVSERDGSPLGSEYLRFTRVRMRLRDRNTVLMWPLYRSRMNLNRWGPCRVVSHLISFFIYLFIGIGRINEFTILILYSLLLN